MTTLIYVSDGRAGADAARRPVLFAGVRRMLRRRAVYRELMGLDERLLADIGLTRAEVAAVAHRAADEAEPRERPSGFSPVRFASAVTAWFAEMVRRRTATAELMALDDRLLADIGLTRGQIPAVVGSAARAGWLRDEVDSLVRPFRLWQRGLEATRTLHTLDDRALADAGMLRAEIGWVAAELAERSLTPANTNTAIKAA